MPDQIPLTQPTPLQNPVQTMSGILGLQQQKQALQTGQYAQQSADAGAQMDQRKAQEQARVSAYMSNPANKGKTADDIQNDIYAIAPTTGQDVIAGVRKNEATKAAVQSALTDLSAKNKSQAGDLIRSLSGGQHSPDQVNSMFDTAEIINPQLKSVLDPLRDRIVHMPPPGPARDQGVAAVATMLDGKSGVHAGEQDAGTKVNITKTDSQGNVTPTGQSFDKTSIGTTGTGQAAIVGPKGVSVLPDNTPKPPVAPPAGPRSAQDDAPGANAPKAVQENYQTASKAAQEHVDSTRKADEGYGNNISISNTIRHLASDTKTGPGTETYQKAMAALGVNSGSNYQELGAFLDRQAASLRDQMGLPGTNAGAQDAKAIAGNTQYTPKVIQDKNDYTQALVEGTHQYRHGLDRIAGFSGQASPKAVNEFKSAWADNFDPNVYKADLAKKQGKLGEFVNSLDPKEAASLAKKRKNLQSLANGQIPQ